MKPKNSIQATKVYNFGGWELEKLNIKDVNIPVPRVIDLQLGAYSSNGVLKKFNINHQKMGLCYIKSGSSRGKFFSIRFPIIEVICYEIGKLLGFDVIPYKLWTIDRRLFEQIENIESHSSEYGKYQIDDKELEKPSGSLTASFQKTLQDHQRALVTICPSFINKNEVFYSCAKLYNDIPSKELYNILCTKHPLEVKKKLDQMIVFDYLIHNTDRHLKNFGFIVDDDNEYFTPLFDHGLALLSEFEDVQLEEDEMEVVGYVPGKPFGSLLGSLKLIDLNSLDSINMDVTVEELHAIISRYSELLSPIRIRLMKQIIEQRWNHVRKILSAV